MDIQFIRLYFFLGILLALMFFEFLFPRRDLHYSRKTRWTNNLSLIFLNSAIIRFVLPITLAGIALFTEERKIGAFNLFSGYTVIKTVLSIIILDLAIYWQHVLFHKIPLFWLIHRMHHTDLDIDVTSGLRFHPIEIIISTIIKVVVIVIFGMPVLSVIIFEILLNATSMFNHSNIFIPLNIDHYLRLFIVTPDMHRVHHSIFREETNSNFGFNLACWDRVFKTYHAQPKVGHLKMNIGLETFRDIKYLNLPWLLIIPFIKGR